MERNVRLYRKKGAIRLIHVTFNEPAGLYYILRCVKNVLSLGCKFCEEEKK
jgi:hypothetical protein